MKRAPEPRSEGDQPSRELSASPCLRGPSRSERGFTIVEFMIAAAIMAAVLSGTVMLATQMQQLYSTQLEDATVEEEVRFSLDWIAQTLRNAASNPYSIGAFVPIDVNADGSQITLLADINPPDGDTTDEGEDLTIGVEDNMLKRTDNNTLAEELMTEPVISAVLFTLFDSSGTELGDGEEGATAYVRVRVTGRSQVTNTLLGDNAESVLETEVRLRTR